MQSVEGMRGVFQQEMQSLKAERSQLREALHDVKWAASQAAGPHQAAVSLCYCWCLVFRLVSHVSCVSWFMFTLLEACSQHKWAANVAASQAVGGLARSSLTTGSQAADVAQDADRQTDRSTGVGTITASQQSCSQCVTKQIMKS